MRGCTLSYVVAATALKSLPLLAGMWATPIVEHQPGEPQIAIHQDGNMVVISENEFGPNHIVEATVYNHETNDWTTPAGLSPPELDAQAYRLATGPEGDAVAVWQVSDGELGKIQASLYMQAANAWSPAIDLCEMEPNLSIDLVGMSETGNILITWKEAQSQYDLCWSAKYSKTHNHWTKNGAKLVVKKDKDKPDVLFDRQNGRFLVRDQKNNQLQLVPVDAATDEIKSLAKLNEW